MIAPAPFDPLGFLTLAEQLVNDSAAAEAHYRSALSRAYYGLFLLARERLAAKGLFVPLTSGEDHRDVITRLRSMSQRTGDQLDSLRTNRNRADYNLAIHISLRHARQAIGLAKALEANLSSTVP